MESRMEVSQSIEYNLINLYLHDDPNRPNIHFVWVPFVLQNLRSNVIGSSADGFLFLTIVLDSSRQTEIPELYFHILIEKKVP